MIVFTVLFWILIIMVGLLLGLILLLFILLALPIRYEVRATNINELYTLVRIRYLFGLIRYIYELKDGIESSCLMIAWKDVSISHSSILKTLEKSQESLAESQSRSIVGRFISHEKDDESSPDGFIKTVKNTKELLTSRRGKTIMSLCMDACKNLWKILRPYKFELTGVVGLGDPGSTGVFFGLYSMFVSFFKTGKAVNLAADFQSDDVKVEFNLVVRGMVSVIRVAVLLIRLVIKKPMRELIKEHF